MIVRLKFFVLIGSAVLCLAFCAFLWPELKEKDYARWNDRSLVAILMAVVVFIWLQKRKPM